MIDLLSMVVWIKIIALINILVNAQDWNIHGVDKH